MSAPRHIWLLLTSHGIPAWLWSGKTGKPQAGLCVITCTGSPSQFQSPRLIQSNMPGDQSGKEVWDEKPDLHSLEKELQWEHSLSQWNCKQIPELWQRLLLKLFLRGQPFLKYNPFSHNYFWCKHASCIPRRNELPFSISPNAPFRFWKIRFLWSRLMLILSFKRIR